jgi:hypothetical protein
MDATKRKANAVHIKAICSLMSEAQEIRELFDKLVGETERTFPALGQKLDAPELPGVYVIYSPEGIVDHVGESTSIAGRLRGHMGNASSYVNQYLKHMGSQLRGAYKFRCLPIDNSRQRMLLQALAIGLLCPQHIGDRAKDRGLNSN